MIPSRAEVPDNNSTKTGRPKLTGGSRGVLTLVTVVVYSPLLFLAPTLHSILENAQCPTLTFYSHYIFMGSSALVFGLMTVTVCPSVIIGLGGNALRLWQYEPPYVPSPSARRAYSGVTAIALIALVAGWGALIDDADRFFCMSPDGILARRGLRDTAHRYSWSDVRTMYVSCLISHLPKTAAFPATDISLDLRNGEQLLLGLRGSDERTLMYLKASLNYVDYKFYVNRTVTPELCPAELYEHIWNWLNE